MRLRKRLPRDLLNELYHKQRKSLEDIAKLYGVSRMAIFKYCKSSGISLRSKSNARLEAQRQGKVPQNYFDINENFFKLWSHKMAYALGLLFTDGCMSKGTISLCLNDRELLEKFKKMLMSGHPIVASKYQKGLYLFNFARKEIIEDLHRLGMVPRKSFIIKFPDVPDEYVRDFIRGVFDGDGSVFFEPRNPDYPIRAHFVSGSKDFIEVLENRLNQLGLNKRTIYIRTSKYEFRYGKSKYEFRYAHEDSIKLFHILYDGVDNSLYLERKYNKFIEGMHR